MPNKTRDCGNKDYINICPKVQPLKFHRIGVFSIFHRSFSPGQACCAGEARVWGEKSGNQSQQAKLGTMIRRCCNMWGLKKAKPMTGDWWQMLRMRKLIESAEPCGPWKYAESGKPGENSTDKSHAKKLGISSTHLAGYVPTITWP